MDSDARQTNISGFFLPRHLAGALLVFLMILSVILNVPIKKIVINNRSGKYHRVRCIHADRINRENRTYVIEGDPRLKKLNPCRVCRPRTNNKR